MTQDNSHPALATFAGAHRAANSRASSTGQPAWQAGAPDYRVALRLVDPRARAILAVDVGFLRRHRRQGRRDRIWSTATRCPARAGFRDARLNFAENLLRRRDARDRDRVLGREQGPPQDELSPSCTTRCRVLRRRLRALGVKPGDRVAGVHAQHARDHHRDARDDQHRRDLVVLLAGFRRAGRARPLRADRAEGAVLRRRLLLQRQDARHAAARRGNRRGSCHRWKESSSCPTSSPSRCIGDDPQRGALWTLSSPLRSRADIEFERSCRSIIRSTSCIRRAPPACRNASCTAPAARLLQHLKEHQLHTDLKRGDRLFYFTTCGWMMWNWLVSGLATGATLLLYDGSPFYPEPAACCSIFADTEKHDDIRHLGQIHRRARQARRQADAKRTGWAA